MFKFLSKIIQLTILVAVLAILFRNYVAKAGLEFWLHAQLGTPVSVQEAQVDLTKTWVLFRGIRFENPPDFPDPFLASVPKLFIQLDLHLLGEKRLRFRSVEITLDELQVIRDVDGKMNLLSLNVFQTPRTETKSFPSSLGERAQTGAPKVEIDRLVLNMGKVKYIDLAGAQPKQIAMNMDIHDAVYRNIAGSEDVVKIIVWEIMKRLGFSGLSSILEGVQGKLAENANAGSGGLLSKIVSAIKEKTQ
ncbi:MAG: hypothetical protein PHN49_01125 [Candidatus Omnitrophica bacterium]|nr:hypothetical protein [Candidatus Omnitrophota bacterium]MDD5670221.1 hypothetical protein [Candidatus Omnitrophota bacterium]